MAEVAPARKEIEVNKDDQARINKFSRLNNEFQELEEDIAGLQKKIQTLNDAGEEVMVCMEADGLMFRFGECFFNTDDTSAGEMIDEMKGKAEEELRGLTDRIEKVRDEMDSDKKMLYGKFGDCINLER